MKGVLLAGASFALIVLLAASAFRAYSGKKYYRLLVPIFGVALAAYLAAHRSTPADLGFLPESLLEPSTAVDAATGALVLALLFHCFWDGIYLLFAGFSANLIVLEAQDPTLTVERVLASFGVGSEDDRILAWRIPNLERNRFAERSPGGVRLLPRGRLLGRAVRFLKVLLTGSGEG